MNPQDGASEYNLAHFVLGPLEVCHLDYHSRILGTIWLAVLIRSG